MSHHFDPIGKYINFIDSWFSLDNDDILVNRKLGQKQITLENVNNLQNATTQTSPISWDNINTLYIYRYINRYNGNNINSRYVGNNINTRNNRNNRNTKYNGNNINTRCDGNNLNTRNNGNNINTRISGSKIYTRYNVVVRWQQDKIGEEAREETEG